MANIEFLKSRPIAHRGFFNKQNGIPENSLPAFEKAVLQNYVIETDVHLLKDGSIVVFHDDNLSRMTGDKRQIKDCTYDEIKNLKLNGTKYGIPLFSELIDLVNGKVPLLIEIKSDRKVGETEKELMKILKEYKGNYAVQSFNPKSVFWFKKNYPMILRGQLSAEFNKDKMLKIHKYILKNLYFNFLTKPDFVSYCVDAFPNKRVENFRKSGKLVLSWTIKNADSYKKAQKYSDNIIGENFDYLE